MARSTLFHRPHDMYRHIAQHEWCVKVKFNQPEEALLWNKYKLSVAASDTAQ